MKLDVVIPTYNRAVLLTSALNSLKRAAIPSGLSVNLFVVDNNCKDNTAEVVHSLQPQFPFPIHYLLERTQGRSAALNAGIAAGRSDLIGFIDDDEEVASDWFEVLHRKFVTDSMDFIGGPYIPNWSAAKPQWISKEFGSIVGWVDGGAEEKSYGPGFGGMLMGGNAVLKRKIFDAVGLYNSALGRTDKGLLSCEDDDMFHRILAAGFNGKYVPQLVIYHYIPPERMTRRYHRRWCWGHGISLGVMSRSEKANVPEILGVPRWQIRHAAAGAWQALKGLAGFGVPERAFEGELRLWDFAGYINGRHFLKSRTGKAG